MEIMTSDGFSSRGSCRVFTKLKINEFTIRPVRDGEMTLSVKRGLTEVKIFNNLPLPVKLLPSKISRKGFKKYLSQYDEIFISNLITKISDIFLSNFDEDQIRKNLGIDDEKLLKILNQLFNGIRETMNTVYDLQGIPWIGRAIADRAFPYE
jgi:hypothetical protein